VLAIILRRLQHTTSTTVLHAIPLRSIITVISMRMKLIVIIFIVFFVISFVIGNYIIVRVGIRNIFGIQIEIVVGEGIAVIVVIEIAIIVDMIVAVDILEYTNMCLLLVDLIQ